MKRPSKRRSGLSLLEVAISTFLVGLVLVGALRAVGASLRSAGQTSQRVRSLLLAEELMAEILQQAYIDAGSDPRFGPESGESVAGSRAAFDDVDDYHGWDESPLVRRDGAAIAGTDGWRRQVRVEHISADDLATALSTSEDSGIKRITVTTSFRGKMTAEAICVQTESWIPMIPEAGQTQTTGQTSNSNRPPVAVLEADVLSGGAPLTVGFDATASSDPDGQPLTYYWDFGDGASATGAKPSHTFSNTTSSTLTRIVTLTAADPLGAESQATTTITIFPP